SGGYAYIADGTNGVVIVDVTNPRSPTLAGHFTKTDDLGFGEQRSTNKIGVYQGYVYIATFSPFHGENTCIVDARNPAAPTFVKALTGFRPSALTVAGNRLYLGGISSMQIFDLSSTPSDPPQLGFLNTFSTGVYAIAVSGTKAYLALTNGRELLWVVDV